MADADGSTFHGGSPLDFMPGVQARSMVDSMLYDQCGRLGLVGAPPCLKIGIREQVLLVEGRNSLCVECLNGSGKELSLWMRRISCNGLP